MDNQYYQKMQELMKYMIFAVDQNNEDKYATHYTNLESIDLTTGQLQNLKRVKDQWWELLIKYMSDEESNIGHPFFRKNDFPQYKGITQNTPSTIEFITNMIDFPASFMDKYLDDIKKELIRDNELIDRKRINKIATLVINAILSQTMDDNIAKLIECTEIDDLKISSIQNKIVKGDLNDDGNIDVEDLILMQKKVASWKVDVDDFSADVNGDNSVDVEDLILMQKKIAGWNVAFSEDTINYFSCRNLTPSSREYFSKFEKELREIDDSFDDYQFSFLSDFVRKIINKNLNYPDILKTYLINGISEVLFTTYQNNHYDYFNEHFKAVFEALNIDINDIINIDLSNDIILTTKQIIRNFVDFLIDYCFPQTNHMYIPNTSNDCLEMVKNIENYFISGKLELDETDERPEDYRYNCKANDSPIHGAAADFLQFENQWKKLIEKKGITSSSILQEAQYAGLKNLLEKMKNNTYKVFFSNNDINYLKNALSVVYFYYYNKNELFSWEHSAFDSFYSLLSLTPTDIKEPTKSFAPFGWNNSVDLLIKNILNGFDYSLIKYDNKATIEVKPDIFFKMSDILKGDAGNSFKINEEWVKSWKNSNEQTYQDVRSDDVKTSAITNDKQLDFTKDSSWDEIGIRLLMPQYNRNVEIEDLDRNFWVIGQTLTGLMAFLFGENSPFKIVFQGIIKEIVELWENILYLWLGFAMTLSDKVSYDKIHEEIIYLPLNTLQNGIKYDNFDLNEYSTSSNTEDDFETQILQQSGDTIIDKIKNYLEENGEDELVNWIIPKLNYLLSEYSDSHLGILPVIRLNNYEDNLILE